MCIWPSSIERVLRRWPRTGTAAGIALSFALGAAAAVPAPTGQPALQVDHPFPTADKPQSKLWQAGGTWFALLPRSTGPSLWERTATGWREQPAVAEKLRGVPSRADVWFDHDGVTAVTVADRLLAIVRLRREPGAGMRWDAEVLGRLGSPVSDGMETATIARDRTGMWCVAAPVSGRIFAWVSQDGRAWAEPVQLAAGVQVDDICLVTPLDGGVAVIWSDQKRDAVRLRLHRAGAETHVWEPAVTISQGGRTADDHLDAAVEADGTLWLATKNSVDGLGQPQLVLRVRRPDGVWHNYPYAPLSANEAPSRPCVIATATPGDVRLGHVVYAGPASRRDFVVFGRADPGHAEVLVQARTVIAPIDPAARVNDITGPKAAFSPTGPWIVLASDAQGRVYEADISDPPGK